MGLKYNIVASVCMFVLLCSAASCQEQPTTMMIYFYNNSTNQEYWSMGPITFANNQIEGPFFSFGDENNIFSIQGQNLDVAVVKANKTIDLKIQYTYSNGTIKEQYGTVIGNKLIIKETKITTVTDSAVVNDNSSKFLGAITIAILILGGFGIAYKVASFYFKRKKGGKN